jgi:hypothetical protein
MWCKEGDVVHAQRSHEKASISGGREELRGHPSGHSQQATSCQPHRSVSQVAECEAQAFRGGWGPYGAIQGFQVSSYSAHTQSFHPMFYSQVDWTNLARAGSTFQLRISYFYSSQVALHPVGGGKAFSQF